MNIKYNCIIFEEIKLEIMEEIYTQYGTTWKLKHNVTHNVVEKYLQNNKGKFVFHSLHKIV